MIIALQVKFHVLSGLAPTCVPARQDVNPRPNDERISLESVSLLADFATAGEKLSSAEGRILFKSRFENQYQYRLFLIRRRPVLVP